MPEESETLPDARPRAGWPVAVVTGALVLGLLMPRELELGAAPPQPRPDQGMAHPPPDLQPTVPNSTGARSRPRANQRRQGAMTITWHPFHEPVDIPKKIS